MKSRRVYIPAVLVALLALGLIIYYYMTMPERPEHGAGMPPGEHAKGEHGEGHGPLHGVVKLLGQISIVLGAISFWWLLFKKKLASPSAIIKKVGRLVYSAHTYAGWAALILVVVHSVYFLVTDFDNFRTFSGLAAFALMAALAVYGWLLKRYPNRFMRATHLMLSLLWIPASFIHGGGIVVMVTVATVVLFGVVGFLDKRAAQPAA